MGLNDSSSHCLWVKLRSRPRRCNQSGNLPRDKLSAVRFALDGNHCGDILHSNVYLHISHIAKYRTPDSPEQRPFFN